MRIRKAQSSGSVRITHSLRAMRHADVMALTSARAAARSGEARKIRTAAGLSLAEVGAVCGRSGATISRWEHGLLAPGGAPGVRYARLISELRELLAEGVAS